MHRRVFSHFYSKFQKMVVRNEFLVNFAAYNILVADSFCGNCRVGSGRKGFTGCNISSCIISPPFLISTNILKTNHIIRPQAYRLFYIMCFRQKCPKMKNHGSLFNHIFSTNAYLLILKKLCKADYKALLTVYNLL